MLKKTKKEGSLKPLSKKKAVSKAKESLMAVSDLEVVKRSYEVMFILDSDLSENKRKEKMQEIKSMITASGGVITFEDDSWGTRKLCYKIKRKWFGFYYLLNFTLASKELLEISNQWNIDHEILRNLVIKLPDDYQPKKYTEIKDKFEVESLEEKNERNLNRTKRARLKKEEAKNKPVLQMEKEEVKKVAEVKEVVADEVKEVKEEKEIEKEPKSKKETLDPLKTETSSDDHLKELNDKLDKLLLSDDISNL